MGKVTDYHGADIRRNKLHGFVRSGYPPLNISRSGAGFSSVLRSGYPLAGKVTECHGADIRHYNCRGLLRSGYPSHVFFHGAVYLTASSNPHQTADFPSVHRSNYPLN